MCKLNKNMRMGKAAGTAEGMGNLGSSVYPWLVRKSCSALLYQAAQADILQVLSAETNDQSSNRDLGWMD